MEIKTTCVFIYTMKHNLVGKTYLVIFVGEHDSWDMEGVILVENNGGVVERWRRDDGGDGLRRPAYVKCGGSNLLLLVHVMLRDVTLFARAGSFPCD